MIAYSLSFDKKKWCDSSLHQLSYFCMSLQSQSLVLRNQLPHELLHAILYLFFNGGTRALPTERVAPNGSSDFVVHIILI